MKKSIRLFALLAIVLSVARVAVLADTPTVVLTGSTISAAQTLTKFGLVRDGLTSAETAATMEFQVSLQMRSFSELQARVRGRQHVAREEIAAKYLPLEANYKAVSNWLVSQGFTITRDDPSFLLVSASGPVSLVSRVFGVNFSRVTDGEQEYSSATNDPVFPADLAPLVLGVNGLQPNIRMHKSGQIIKNSGGVPYGPPFTPHALQTVYHVLETGLTGSGQEIAIVMDGFPAASDLAAFWSAYTPQPVSVTDITISTPTTNPDLAEVTADVELAGAWAPAAQIRVYMIVLNTVSFNAALSQIYNDLAAHPGLHQVSFSAGLGESWWPQSDQQTANQLLTTLTSAGVTVFASSGDGGSNPDSGGNYSAISPLQPQYPASDPSVVGVGGTTLQVSTSGVITSETGWHAGGGASGGGVSTIFSRPTWQAGSGVLTGSNRQVPDVALVGDWTQGVVTYVGGYLGYGGTSVAAPMWCGMCALLNQSRAANGVGPVGLLQPYIYPLIGTASFNDITAGDNWTYSCAAGYDMVTGVGTPNFAQLVAAVNTEAPVTITGQPLSASVAPNQSVTLTVGASVLSGSANYQWQVMSPGGTWGNVSNGGAYSGANTGNLVITTASSLDGDEYRCVITAGTYTATSAPAMLVVQQPLAIGTMAGLATITGSTDGTGSAARFNGPAGMASDANGDIYVADANNQSIRVISPAGAVTTLAAAQFNHPTGVAISSSGNVYVADTANNVIKEISASGVVTTLAGFAGTTGSLDGTGSAALFNGPSGIAIDSSGNLYVTDTLNNTVRMIAPGGVVTTLAGKAGVSGQADGAATAARFSAPEGIAVNSSSTIFVADTNNHTIRSISNGQVVTYAGAAGQPGAADGTSEARFNGPTDVAVDSSGNVYVADTDNDTVRVINTARVVATVAGLAGVSGASDGTGTSVRFHYPTGVCIDPSGDLFVSDTDNNTIRVVPMPPTIISYPTSQSVTVGATASFSVNAMALPAPTYQWFFNGQTIAGATSATLCISSAQISNAGTYTVAVTNTISSTTSPGAALTVNSPVQNNPAVAADSSGGGGGGGGAPSWWYFGAMLLLAASRRFSSVILARS